MSREPEFLAEAERIGPITQRVHAPPVFRNPFTHNIPGYISGPEDLIETTAGSSGEKEE